jgi:hypothetical protein
LTSPQQIGQGQPAANFSPPSRPTWPASFRTEVDGAPAFSALTSTNNQFQFTVNGCATFSHRNQSNQGGL